MTDPLTPNAIHRLNGGDVDLRPILQVMDVRQIGNSRNTAQERYRLVLSDGNAVQQAMLATELNDSVKSKAVVKGTIVQLVDYICTTAQNRTIIFVLDMEIRHAMSDIIGNPVPLLASGSEQVTGASNGGPANPENGPHSNGYGMTNGTLPGYQGQRGVGMNSSVGRGVDCNGFGNASPYGSLSQDGSE